MGRIIILSIGTVQDASSEETRLKLTVQEIVPNVVESVRERAIARIAEALAPVQDIAATIIDLPVEVVPAVGERTTMVVLARNSDTTATAAISRLAKGTVLSKDALPALMERLAHLAMLRSQESVTVPIESREATGTLRFSESIQVFDPTVSVSDSGQATIFIRAGVEVVQALIERVLHTGRTVSSEVVSGIDIDDTRLRLAVFESLAAPPESRTLTGRLAVIDAVGVSVEGPKSIADFFKGKELSFTVAASPPNGGLGNIILNTEAVEMGAIEVGDFPRASIGDMSSQNLKALLYHFSVPKTLTDDRVRVKYELPAPNYLLNWHFGNDLASWTDNNEANTGHITVAWSATEGFRSAGCLQITSTVAENNAAFRTLSQTTQTFPTGASRVIRLKARHRRFGVDAGGTLEIRVRNTSGDLLKTITLADATAWTLSDTDVTAEVGTTLTALKIEIAAQDNSGVLTLDRRVDDVRLEVSFPATHTIAETTAVTYGTAGGDTEHPAYLYKETFEAYTLDASLADWGWKQESLPVNTTATVSNDQAFEGTRSAQLAANAVGSDRVAFYRELIDGWLAGVMVYHIRKDTTDVTGSMRFFSGTDATGILFAVDFDDAGSIKLSSVDEGPQTIGSYVANKWYRVIIARTAGGKIFVDVRNMTDAVDVGTARATDTGTAFSVAIQKAATAGSGVRNVWFDSIEFRYPLVVDVSAESITQDDAKNLIAFVEYEQNDAVARESECFVEAIGVRYEVST